MAACGWRALMARMAAPLSGMATSDHSCSGDAPLGFGSTVTIFHPVVMHLRLTSSLVSAHPTTSTRRPNQFTATSLPGRVPRDHRELALGGGLATTVLQQRPESAGDGNWAGFSVVRLCSEQLFPVCSPKLVSGSNRITRASDLLKFSLLRLDDWKTWSRWFEAAGVTDPRCSRSGSEPREHADRCCLDGHGIALARGLPLGAEKRPAFIKSAPACSLRQSCNHHRRIVGVCVRSWAEFSSDRGLVDPQSPPLAQAHQ